MRQAKKNWVVIGLAALAAGMTGCAQHYYHAEGDPNTQPGVDTDAPASVMTTSESDREREAQATIVPAQQTAAAAVPAPGSAVPPSQPTEEVVVVSKIPEATTAPVATAPATAPKVYGTSEKWLNHNPEPSLKGLDRSGWEPTVYLTDPGTVEHYNYYHRDLPTGYEKRHDADLKRAVDDPAVTLNGYKTEGFEKDNTLEMFSQPGKFAYDTVLMFPMMIFRPPWGTDYTPRKETLAPAVKEKPVDITQVPTQPAPAPVKSDLPQLPAWPTDTAPVKPEVIPPLEFDTSPGM